MFFFFHHPAPTQTYTLSLHDALPISELRMERLALRADLAHVAEDQHPRPLARREHVDRRPYRVGVDVLRSEEHTSELQSLRHLVCRLLLEKKKKKKTQTKQRRQHKQQ